MLDDHTMVVGPEMYVGRYSRDVPAYDSEAPRCVTLDSRGIKSRA